MEKEGAKYVEIKGFDDKRQLTAVFGANNDSRAAERGVTCQQSQHY